MIFANAAEQNISTEIFRTVKIIDRRPRANNEIKEINGTPIDGQFYREELTPVGITTRTTYKIDKILDKRVRRGIREYLVRWQEYIRDFDSWVPASSFDEYLTLRSPIPSSSICLAMHRERTARKIHTPISL